MLAGQALLLGQISCRKSEPLPSPDSVLAPPTGETPKGGSQDPRLQKEQNEGISRTQCVGEHKCSPL